MYSNYMRINRPIWQWLLMYSSAIQLNRPDWQWFLYLLDSMWAKQAYLNQLLLMFLNSMAITSPIDNNFLLFGFQENKLFLPKQLLYFLCILISCKHKHIWQWLYVFKFHASKHAHLTELLHMYSNFNVALLNIEKTTKKMTLNGH